MGDFLGVYCRHSLLEMTQIPRKRSWSSRRLVERVNERSDIFIAPSRN
jgi:hypothetical protein